MQLPVVKVLKELEFTGGHDTIKARSRNELDQEIPGILDRLATERGKIVFLGNGLSYAPVYEAERFENGELQTPPVINDIYSYGLILEDLNGIFEVFKKNGLPFPFPAFMRNAKYIVDAIDRKALFEATYCFGTNCVPPVLRGADLVINSFGPPSDFILEQLSLLTPGGQLLMSEERVLSQSHCYPDFRFEPLYDEVRDLRAVKITKIS